jgi:RND family efflux transporter MFP subunit
MNKPRFPQGFGILLVAGFLSAGCGETSLPPPPGPPVVTIAVPVEQTVTDHVDFSGKTAAVESVELRARVDGYLQTVQYEEGNEVKKDQVLFGIDPRPYQIELDRANAQVKAAEAQAAQSESTYRRSATLMRSNATSVEQLEKDRRTRDVSAAVLAAARANVQLKQINRDFTNVLAPINGRVDKADATVGNLVSANLNNANVLTNIVRMEPMYAYFDVDELTALRLLDSNFRAS